MHTHHILSIVEFKKSSCLILMIRDEIIMVWTDKYFIAVCTMYVSYNKIKSFAIITFFERCIIILRVQEWNLQKLKKFVL